MSFIDTDGRFPRFLTRAQKWAITSESAPSSSKKWLSTDTWSTRRTPASTSARMLSTPVVAALPRSPINVDSAIAPILNQRRFDHRPRTMTFTLYCRISANARSWNSIAVSRIGRGSGRRGVLPAGELRSEPCAECSSHGLVEEVGQAQLPAAGDRLVVHPLADRQVEYPHAERGENDRTATIHGSSSGHDVGKSARHKASISRLLLRKMGRGVGLHDVLDVVNHVLRSQEYRGCELAKGNMQHQRVVLEEPGIGDVGRRSNGREKDQITGPHKLCDVGNDCDRAVPLEVAHCVSEFLTLERRPVV